MLLKQFLSADWHFPLLALFAKIFCVIENLSPSSAGTPISIGENLHAKELITIVIFCFYRKVRLDCFLDEILTVIVYFFTVSMNFLRSHVSHQKQETVLKYTIQVYSPQSVEEVNSKAFEFRSCLGCRNGLVS